MKFRYVGLPMQENFYYPTYLGVKLIDLRFGRFIFQNIWVQFETSIIRLQSQVENVKRKIIHPMTLISIKVVRKFDSKHRLHKGNGIFQT